MALSKRTSLNSQRRLLPYFGVLFLLTTLSVRTRADEPASSELYQKTLRSTAMVVVPNGDKASQGTGWLIDRDRKLLVTNRHVVGAQKQIQAVFPIYQNGELVAERTYYLKEAARYRGRVIETHAAHDLAIVQLDFVPSTARSLKLAPERPRSHDSVLLIGNPGGNPNLWIPAVGTIQNAPPERVRIKFTDQDLEARVDVFETKTPVRPGSSGGPVVNKDGALVAVTSGVDRETRVVGIDVSEVREFVTGFYHNEGTRHHNLGNFRQAVADYTAAIALDPSDARAYHYRGISHKFLDNFSEAVADCSQAIRLDPQNARAYNERGAARSYLDEYDLAIRDYTSAIRLDPSFALAYRNRGSCLARKGEWEDAISDYTAAIRLDRHDAKAYLKRSQAYAQLGDRAQAQDDYEDAIRLDPSLAHE
jgi:tetratricopeptide (TPR) repeat protein